MFLWTLWIAQTASPASAVSKPDTTVARADTTVGLVSTADSLELGPYAPFLAQTESLLTVETPLYRLVLSTKGGQIRAQALAAYQDANGASVRLWQESYHSRLTFGDGRYLVPLHSLGFSVLYTPRASLRQGRDSVVFRLSIAPDTFIQISYLLTADDYHITRRVYFHNLRNRLRNPYVTHSVSLTTPQTEQSADLMRPHCGLYYKQADDVEHLTPEDEDLIQKNLQGRIRWVSVKGHFFAQIFRAGGFYEAARLRSLPVPGLPQYELEFQLPLQGETVEESWYLGPLKFSLVRQYKEDYDRQLNLGWAFIRYINTGFILPIFSFLEQFIPSYGIIILILAVLVKLILSPLTWQSYLATARMQVVNELPEIKALDEKYKDDPNKLMIEKSLLYRQLGINPLSGCLPLLLQMPLFFAMVSFFPSAFELRQQSFLWAKDLSTYDALIAWGVKIPILGDHLSLFALLTALTTLAYTYLSPQSTSATPGMRWLPYLTPVIFFLFLNSYSAALSWYYTVLNVLTIGQTLLMKRFIDKEAIIARLRQRQKAKNPAIGRQRQQMRRWARGRR